MIVCFHYYCLDGLLVLPACAICDMPKAKRPTAFSFAALKSAQRAAAAAAADAAATAAAAAAPPAHSNKARARRLAAAAARAACSSAPPAPRPRATELGGLLSALEEDLAAAPPPPQKPLPGKGRAALDAALLFTATTAGARDPLAALAARMQRMP